MQTASSSKVNRINVQINERMDEGRKGNPNVDKSSREREGTNELSEKTKTKFRAL